MPGDNLKTREKYYGSSDPTAAETSLTRDRSRQLQINRRETISLALLNETIHRQVREDDVFRKIECVILLGRFRIQPQSPSLIEIDGVRAAAIMEAAESRTGIPTLIRRPIGYNIGQREQPRSPGELVVLKT